MTYLTAKQASTLAVLNAHHHGDSVEKHLIEVLDKIRTAALQGHRETSITNLSGDAGLSEVMEALKTLGYLGKTVRAPDDTYILNLCW